MNSVTIIGGGIGGLFTGAILAKEGWKVTVLEKNAVAGGGLQCFTRNGAIFETGMHVMGGFRHGGSLHKICRYLGILEDLAMVDVDDDCMDEVKYLSDGSTYRIASGKERFIESLASYFPKERENIRRYVDELYSIADEVALFNLRPSSDNIMVHSERFNIAADRLIAEFTDDKRLQDLLAYLNPLYGGVAGHTPAYIHALINVLYINGATRFAGGSQQLADRLSDLIRINGGEVHTNHEVTDIRVEDRTICEIVTKSGSFKSEKYISAVHPCELLRLLPEKVFPKSYRTRLQEIPNSNSAFSLFIKLRSGTFPYINHTCYYQDDYGDVWHHTTYNPNRWPKGFMYMTPPDENQGEYAERMLINCIMDFEPVKRWEETRVGHRGKEYELWKQELTDRILERMEDLRPGFKQCVESVYAASPLTIRDFYHTKEGAIFGYRKDCENILLSQVPIYTKISNLLLTGQNINLHGICGVPLTAINTAEALLGRNAVINKINECYV